MKRDIFVLKSFFDLDEFLSKQFVDVRELEAVLGIGFYRALKSKEHTGVELSVSPPHLKPKILELVGKGFFSPLDEPLFFVGGSEASAKMPWARLAQKKGGEPERALSRWLLCGLLPKNLNVGMRGEEIFGDLLRSAFAKILELRPSAVVFLADFELIQEYFVRSGISSDAKQLAIELMTWLVEESMHPRTAIVCKNESDFEILVAHSKKLLLGARMGEAVTFHL